MLYEIYGFDDATARKLLGDPIKIQSKIDAKTQSQKPTVNA